MSSSRKKSATANLNEIDPATLLPLLKHCMQRKEPAMIWGSPGIGKSDMIAQIGRELDRPVVDLRLILMEPTDIKGIPYYCPTTNKMKWSVSEELPEEGTPLSNCILFLDEINSAPQSVQGAAYQLVLNRKIGAHYKLPDDVVIVAAGNHTTDRGVTYQMPKPLANRFVHFYLTATYDSWLSWAVNEKVHPDVIGFLGANKHYLFQFDPTSQEHAFATPRSWAKVNNLIAGVDNEHLLTNLVSAAVGQGKACEFIAYRKLCNKLPNIKDILTGKLTKIDDDFDPSVHFSLITSLCFEMKSIFDDNEKEFPKVFDNYISFSMNNFSTEMVVFSIKVLFQDFDIHFSPVDSKAWTKFAKEYRKYLPDPR